MTSGRSGSTARVLIFDGGKEVLAGFGDRLSSKASKGLEHLGIEIHTDSIVTDVDRTGVVVKSGGEERRIEAGTKVWAAGVQASPLARMLADGSGAECDRAGRIKVLPDCTIPGHPEVFAIGDMMAMDDLPGVAEVAMQQGIHASGAIKRRLSGKEPKPFRYRDLGSMATISAFGRSLASRGSGSPGSWAGWCGSSSTSPSSPASRTVSRPCRDGRSPSSATAAPNGRSPCSRSSGASPSTRRGVGPSSCRSHRTSQRSPRAKRPSDRLASNRRVRGVDPVVGRRRARGRVRPRGGNGGLLVAPSRAGAAGPEGRARPLRRRALDHGDPVAPPLGQQGREKALPGGRTGGRPVGTPRAVHPGSQGPADSWPPRGRSRVEGRPA